MTLHQTTPMDEIQSRLFSLIGGADPDELRPLVVSQLVVSEREIAEIPGRAEQRGAEFMQAVQEPMQAALHRLKEYHAWLKRLHRSLEPYDHDGVLEAYQEAQNLIPALTAAVERYGREFAAHGPYRTGWANSLVRMAEGINAGQAPEESWDQLVEQFMQIFMEKQRAVEAAPLPGRSLCAKSYGEATEALQAMLALESLEEPGLRPPLENLDRAIQEGERLEKLISESTSGAAPIPATNVLINVVRKREPESKAFVKDYRDLMDSFWDGFERSLTSPAESALVKDEIPRTLEYGDAHDGALEALTAALDRNDQAALEHALEQILATANKLSESREVYAAAVQHQSNVMCGGCGRANPPENRRCEACGTPLAQQVQTSSTFNAVSGPALEETEQLQMTENVARLFQACDDVAEGTISPQQFQEELRTSAQGIKEFAEELDEIAEEVSDESQMTDEMVQIWREQHLPYMQELSAAFSEGIQQCERGLEDMAAFLQDNDKQHLIDGVREVWEGLGAVHRARLSLMATLKMIQDVLDEADEAESISAGA